MEPPCAGKRLADQAGPDDDAVALDERAVRAAREHHLRDSGDRERVRDPGEQREHEERDERREELAADDRHQTIPSPVTARSISLIPTNGATIPPSP